MIKTKNIDHVCLQVSSMDRFKDYYGKLFDFRFFLKPNEPKTMAVESNNIHFFVIEADSSSINALKFQHISFEVEDLKNITDQLDSRSIDYKTGEVDFFKHKNYKWCEWRDPDGIRVECVEII